MTNKDLETLRLQWCPQSPEDVMKLHGVKSYKSLGSGIAIRKGGPVAILEVQREILYLHWINKALG